MVRWEVISDSKGVYSVKSKMEGYVEEMTSGN